MNKGVSLLKRTAIYAIGNMGSKVLSYIMVLVYSYYILPEDLGYYDLVLTTLSMVQPLIMLQINDAVFRYIVDANQELQPTIIASGFQFVIRVGLLAEVGLLLLWTWLRFQYAAWISLLMLSTVMYIFMQDVVRGIGESKLYAGLGIMNSFVMLILEVIGLVFLDLGVLALIISKAASNIVCAVFTLVVSQNVRSGIRSKSDKKVQMSLMKYSLPLVPNAISWWAVNSANRYIILANLGTFYNGVFSMANKFPTVFTMLTSIFGLAWQESAIKEYNTPNRDRFFSDIFCKYYRVLFSLTICAIPTTKLVLEWFAAVEYHSAWRYTGFLYLAASFSALCSFLGTGYQISKETRRSFISTVIAAFTSIVLNVLAVKKIGLHAASISTCIAYVVLFAVRIKHTKRYFVLSIKWIEFASLVVACLLMMCANITLHTGMYTVFLIVVGIIFLLVVNIRTVKQLVYIVLENRLQAKRGG